MQQIIKLTLFLTILFSFEKSHASTHKHLDLMCDYQNLNSFSVDNKKPSFPRKIFAASVATTIGGLAAISTTLVGSVIGGHFGPHIHSPDGIHQDGYLVQGFFSGIMLGLGAGFYIGNLVYSDLTSASANSDTKNHRSQFTFSDFFSTPHQTSSSLLTIKGK